MIEINIDSEYIKLDQLLKLADAVSTGGHAKFLIFIKHHIKYILYHKISYKNPTLLVGFYA